MVKLSHLASSFFFYVDACNTAECSLSAAEQYNTFQITLSQGLGKDPSEREVNLFVKKCVSYNVQKELILCMNYTTAKQTFSALATSIPYSSFVYTVIGGRENSDASPRLFNARIATSYK